MTGSTLTLQWDPVVPMETESKVTGYLVGAFSLQSPDLSEESTLVFDFICVLLCPASGAAEEASLQ